MMRTREDGATIKEDFDDLIVVCVGSQDLAYSLLFLKIMYQQLAFSTQLSLVKCKFDCFFFKTRGSLRWSKIMFKSSCAIPNLP